MKIYIVSGGPASGKGTRCKILADKLGIPTISTGDLLREKAKTDSEIESQLKTGALLSDELVFSLLCERLEKPDCRNGFILDGYPRTLHQAEVVHETLGDEYIIKIIELEVSRETVMQRILGRKTCIACGKTVNDSLGTITCECGGALIIRSDDTPKTLERRLEIFNANQHDIRDFFQGERYGYVSISAEDNPEAILTVI